MEIDKGHTALVELIKTFDGYDLTAENEAGTRKKVIDAILEDVLGWDRVNDVTYEENIAEDGQTEYADYTVRTATTAFIVEAKRAGKAFELPHNRKTARLGGVLSEGDVGKAICQVRDYCRKLAIQFAIATNGSAWIIFPAVRTDGVTFEDTQAHIFRDLSDIRSRFVEFWELLSRQRVIEGNLESAFFGKPKEPDQRRLLSMLRHSGFRLGRNAVYEKIEPGVIAALTDEALLSDVEGLEHCYVKSSERVKYDSRLKMYLKDVKPMLDRKVIRPRAGGDPDVLKKNISQSVGRTPQFLLVLGSVGSGKTTFLHYTRLVSARQEIEGRVVWLYVDFKKATEEDSPRAFLYRQLLELIESDTTFGLGDWEKIGKLAYEPTIENLRRGAMAILHRVNRDEFDKRVGEKIIADHSAVEPYVEIILQYVAERWPMYLVIDNVDQLQDDDYQRRIFAEAQAAARRLSTNVIMSMREGTYLRHRDSPAFDAFQVDTIYIDAPEVRPVLSRRFVYAKRSLENKSAKIVTENGTTFEVKDLASFFDLVAKSVLSDATGMMLEILAAGDIRRGLALVRQFLASGHVSADSVLYAYAHGKPASFPPHEFFKGAIYGGRKNFREDESLMPNIFDSRLGNGDLQLLRLHVVNHLVTLASDRAFEGLQCEELYSDLHRIGVSNASIGQVLEELSAFKVIRTADGRPFTPDSSLIPTRLGGFILRDLVKQFSYLEPCSLEACIYEDHTWQNLMDITNQIESMPPWQRIPLRIERARAFLQYCQVIEERWVVKCKRYQLGGHWDRQVILHEVMTAAEQDFQRVVESVARKNARR